MTPGSAHTCVSFGGGQGKLGLGDLEGCRVQWMTVSLLQRHTYDGDLAGASSNLWVHAGAWGKRGVVCDEGHCSVMLRPFAKQDEARPPHGAVGL